MQEAAQHGGGSRRERERAGEGEVGRSASETDGVGGDATGRGERRREEVVRRGAAGESHQGRGAAQGGDVRVGQRRGGHEIERTSRREEIGAGEHAAGDGGRDGSELEAGTGARLEAQRGARGAGRIGGEVQRGRAAIGGHAEDAEAGISRQRTDGLGEGTARGGTLVFEDTARETGALDGVGGEGERAPVRDDIGAAGRRCGRTELECAARNRDVTGEVCGRAEGQRHTGRKGRDDKVIDVDRGAANARDDRVRRPSHAGHYHAWNDAGGTAHDEAAGLGRAAAGDGDAGGRRADIAGRGRSVEPGRRTHLHQ